MLVFVINKTNFRDLETEIPIWEGRGYTRDGAVQVVFDPRTNTITPAGIFRYFQPMIKRQ